MTDCFGVERCVLTIIKRIIIIIIISHVLAFSVAFGACQIISDDSETGSGPRVANLQRIHGIAKSAVFECGRQRTINHLFGINIFDICLLQQMQEIFCLVCLASACLVSKLNLPEINVFNDDFVCRPYVRSKGRKFERARGRRASRGYKN